MQALQVRAEIDENDDVVIQLPYLVKSHRVRVVDSSGNTVLQGEAESAPLADPQPEVEPVTSDDDPLTAWRAKREEYRQKFIAAGLMREDSGMEIPEGARRLTVEERMRLGTLPPGARSSLDLINEDREDRV